MTGAQYFRAIDSERLEEIYEELDRLEPMEYEEEEYRPTTLLYQYPLGAAILLTLLYSLLINLASVFKWMSKKKNRDDE